MRLCHIENLALLLVLALASTGWAADVSARAHLERGVRLYELQKYAEAIEELNAGYQLEPLPDFLYVLGQSERARGNCKAAVGFFRSFLRQKPAERQAQLAEANIRRCEAQPPPGPTPEAKAMLIIRLAPELSEQAVTKVDGEPVSLTSPLEVPAGTHQVTVVTSGGRTLSETVTLGAGERHEVSLGVAVPALPPPSASSSRAWPWVLGSSLAVGVAGAVLVGLSHGRYGELQQTCAPLCPAGAAGPYPTLNPSGVVLLGVGAAGLVTSFVLWLWPRLSP